MKKKIKLLLSLLTISVLTSCDKEINIPLNIASKEIIIREYVQDILKVYDFEYFAYTYQDCCEILLLSISNLSHKHNKNAIIIHKLYLGGPYDKK